jgi:hypothetical protein
MRVSLVVLVLVGLSVSSYSQNDIKFGVKAGLNVHSVFLSGPTVLGEKARPLPGIRVGGIAMMDLNESSSLTGEIAIVGKGYKEVNNFGDEFKVSVVYLELPVHYIYHFTHFYIGAGPYLAFALGGNAKVNNNTKRDLRIGGAFVDDWSPFDLGFGVNGGTTLGPVDVGWSMDFGLIDSAPKDWDDTFDLHWKNFAFNVFAIYFF